MLAIKELPSLFIQYDKQSQSTHNDEPKIVTRYDIKKCQIDPVFIFARFGQQLSISELKKNKWCTTRNIFSR